MKNPFKAKEKNEEISKELEASLAKVESAKADIHRFEVELSQCGEKMDRAYEANQDHETESTRAACSETQGNYQRKNMELVAARRHLEKTMRENASALRLDEIRKNEQKWQSVEDAFPKMISLAEKIDISQTAVIQMLDELKQIASSTFQIIPEKDVRIFFDSPLGSNRIDGHFQLLLRRNGLTWAKQWFDDPSRIPTIATAINEAKAWALKRRPRSIGGERGP